MKFIKAFESEVSTGNASGKAGVPSIPFGRGYYQSGNNGACGTAFTPSGEPTSTTYKSIKHSKKNLKKKMKHIKKFNEDATATAGNTGGMGNVVAAQPGLTPGEQGTIGSGDIGQSFGAYVKTSPNLKKKLKKNKEKMKKLKKFEEISASKLFELEGKLSIKELYDLCDKKEYLEHRLINFLNIKLGKSGKYPYSIDDFYMSKDIFCIIYTDNNTMEDGNSYEVNKKDFNELIDILNNPDKDKYFYLKPKI